MPHQAPAENSAATATRPNTTLNPGRVLPGGDMRYGNGKTLCDPAGVDRSSNSNGSSMAAESSSGEYSATSSSGNSNMAAGMTTGWTSAPEARFDEARSDTCGGAGGAGNAAVMNAATGDGASSVSTVALTC